MLPSTSQNLRPETNACSRLLAENACAIFKDASPLCDVKLAASECLMSLICGKMGDEAKAIEFEESATRRFQSSATSEVKLVEGGREDFWRIFESYLVHD